MTFPLNNLPSQSKFWAREVEKKVTNLENSLRSSDINNTTRDSQLTVTANQALIAANQAKDAAAEASAAADAAAEAAGLANTAAGVANAAITGLGSLDEATSTYKINASNVTVGSLNADLITAGALSGRTVQTSGTGERVVLANDKIEFFTNGVSTGSIEGNTWDGGNSTNITSSRLLLYSTSGNYIVGDTGIYTGGISSGSLTVEGSLARVALAGGGTTGASITNGGNFVRTSSSQRYKTDIELLDIDLNDLYAVEPKTFKRIEEVEEDGDDARIYPGFIAEELAGTSLDKFVFYSKDEEGNPRPEGIHYPELTAALLLAIKDLNSRIEALETK